MRYGLLVAVVESVAIVASYIQRQSTMLHDASVQQRLMIALVNTATKRNLCFQLFRPSFMTAGGVKSSAGSNHVDVLAHL